MKHFFLISLLAVVFNTATFAQTAPSANNLVKKAGDHLLIQIGSESWGNAPDSIKNRMGGFNKSFNIAIMFNKPFKSNPKFSLAYGIGFGSSNVFFKNTNVAIGATGTKLNFTNTANTDNYKKYKLSYTYLEVPLELRFNQRGENSRKGLKAALGLKVGTLVNAHTKGKELRNSAGQTLNSNVDKVVTRKFFNTSRVAATARVGFGVFSIYGQYQLGNLFKDGVAAPIKPMQIGLSISGF
jgi:hypothetical protein